MLCRYRAKYITGSVLQLLAKPEGGDAWLQGLRSASYEEALSALTTLPGVRWLTCLLHWWGVEYKLREETLGCFCTASIQQGCSALSTLNPEDVHHLHTVQPPSLPPSPRTPHTYQLLTALTHTLTMLAL